MFTVFRWRRIQVEFIRTKRGLSFTGTEITIPLPTSVHSDVFLEA